MRVRRSVAGMSPRVMLGVLVVGLHARAEIITAASCSRADVGQAVARARPGDEVVMPAGTCVWLTTLDLTIPLTLRGADRATTILRDDVPKTTPDETRRPLIRVTAPRVRLSTFTLEGLAPDTPADNKGHVIFDGEVREVRVDHVTFLGLVMTGLSFSGHPTGVVDHCSFDVDHIYGIGVAHDAWDGGSYGDSSWAERDTIGTDELIVVEDCEFLDRATTGAGALVVQSGGRAVLRNSLINNDSVYVPGTDTSGRFRSGRHLEVYRNRFVASPQFVAIGIGGGTGVVFDNSFEGDFSSVVRLEARRASGTFSVWGSCNGMNPLDQNSAANGYACLDQIGRGEGTLLDGTPPMPARWPQQRLDPIRFWGNTSDAGVSMLAIVDPSVIRLGRDVIEGAPRPGYTPLPYPHRLVLETDAGVAVDGGMPDDGGTVVDGGVGAPMRSRWVVVSSCSSTAAPTPLALALLFLLGRVRRVARG